MGLLSDIQNDLDRGAVRLIAEYRSRLMAEAMTLCAARADAEDLVARTLVKVIHNISSYERDDNFYGWMKTVMHNLRRNDLSRPVVRLTSPVEADQLEEYLGADNSTIDAILARSDHDVLRTALENLPQEYREAVSLYYFNELSLKEIAALLGSSTSTISRRLVLSRRILAAKLASKLGKKRPLAILGAFLVLWGVLFGAWEAGMGEWVEKALQPGEKRQSCRVEIGETTTVATPADLEVYRLFDDFEPDVAPTAREGVAERGETAECGAGAGRRDVKPDSLFSAPLRAADGGTSVNIITNGGFEHTTAAATTAGFVNYDADAFWHCCKISDAVSGTWTEFNSSADYQGAGFRKADREGTGSWAAYLAALHQAKEGQTQRNQGVYIYCEVVLERGNYFFEYWIKRKNTTTNKGFVNVDYQKKDDASVRGRIASGSLVSASAYTRVANPSFQIPEDGVYRIVFSLWWDAENYAIPDSPALAAYIDDVGMYRLADDVGGAIKVKGHPNDYGAADPNYGFVEFPKVGDVKTLSAPSEVVEEKTKARCVGYELRDMNGDLVLNANGEPITGAVNTVALAFTTAMRNATLAWLYDASNKVEVVSSAYGTVSGLREETPGCGWGWYGYGENVTLEAHPKHHLIGWSGVPDWGVVDKTYSFIAVEPTTVTPVFAASNRDNLVLNGDFEDCKGFRNGYDYGYNFGSLNSGAWFGSKQVVSDYPSLGIFASHLGLSPSAGDYAAYLYMNRLYEETQSPGVCIWCRVSITEPGVYGFSCDFGSCHEVKSVNQHPYVISATLIRGRTVTPQSEGTLLVSRGADTAQPASWESLKNQNVEIKEPGDYVIKFGLSGWNPKVNESFVGAGIDNVVLKYRRGLGSGTTLIIF